MLEGAAVLRLPRHGCVVRHNDTLHVLEGVSFSLLKQALAAFLRGDRAALRARMRAAGHAAADGRQLWDLFRGLRDRGRSPARLFSAGDLERVLAGHTAARVRVRLRPPTDHAPAPPEPLLFVGPAGWWLGPRAPACMECARLAFAEAWCAAGPTGALLGAATHAAVVLSRDTTARMADAVRRLQAPGASGWLRGSFGAAAISVVLTHPACGRCAPGPTADRAAPTLRATPPFPADAAQAATQALDRLRVSSTETIDRPATPTWRDLPIVTLTWRRAFRDPSGDLALHEGTQVGAGSSLPERLLTARAEAIERILVATRAPDVRGVPSSAMADTLPPAEWGLFAPEQYAARGFPYRPIAPDAPLDWVHAWDLRDERWITLPLDLATGGAHLPGSSTGAAAHTSVDRIVTAGLLEIIEREALQLAWHRGEPPATLDAAALPSRVTEQRAWLEARGWRVSCGHVTGRGGRHVVCAIGEHLADTGPLLPGAAVFTSGASGVFATAVERALRELVTAVEGLASTPPTPGDLAQDLDAAWLDNDPAVIQRIYLDPRMRPALDFFRAGAPLAAPPPDRPDHADDLVRALVAEGLRPLHVDCTTPAAAPFHAAKLLLAGALPHTFATGLLRLGARPFAPPRRVRAPPPPGYRPRPGDTVPYPFPLG